MARNRDNQNVNNQSKNKANITGIVIGSVVIAASVAFGIVSVPVLGILSFGLSAIVAAAGIALGATVTGYNGRKLSKKNKSAKAEEKAQQVEKAENFENVEQAEVVEQKTLNNQKEQVVEKQEQTAPKQKVIYLPGKTDKPEQAKIEEFLTDEIGPNTFTVYNDSQTAILKDAYDREMSYQISKDNRFRYALNDLADEFKKISKEQESGCCVVVRDAESNEKAFKVEEKTFRKNMIDLCTNIKDVRNAIQTPIEENVEEKVL